MNEARRTLGCWLLAAFLERGCDPSVERAPEPLRRERALSAAEIAALARPLAPVAVLRGAGGRAAAEPAPAAPGLGRLLAFPSRLPSPG
jgi:hypothetical protein